MKAKLGFFSLAAVLLGGCASDVPPTPRIQYPVTYQVPIGNTSVRSDYGPQNLSTQATQQVTVETGRPIYYQVVSPVDVSVSVNELSGPKAARHLVSQMQGTSFTAMVTPTTPALEFTFSPVQANTGGTVRFTLSDRPINL
ncbi:hypothetical protein DB347_02675 [Opitutaceae bacterium EW11]|nr:hypothetical protein DB347_02675 [Opitutaceae bacterium EW11]